MVSVASAAASHSWRKRSRIASYSASSSLRIMNQADVRSGMMLAAVPPSRMIPWTRAVGWSCWRHRPDRGEQQDQRVERVLAAPRVRRGVRLQAREDDVDVLRRERVALDVVAVARVVEQRRVEALEQAVVDHDLLAAPPLLGRRAEEDDLAGQLVGERREGDRGPDPRGGHRVVAAAVAEPGQRVVLGEDPDPRPVAGPDRGAWRGSRSRRLPAGCSTANPWRRQDSRRPRPRRGLLEGGLGVGVDPMRQVDDLVAGRLDGRGEAGLGVFERARRVGWRSTRALGLLADCGRAPGRRSER